MQPQTELSFKAHAVAEYPREACGVVAVIKGREQFLPCRNLSNEANDSFQLDPADYAAAEDLGEIIAIAHSHPDMSSRASMCDLTSCETTNLPWYIVSVSSDNEAAEVRAGDVNRIAPAGYVAPLVGRQFYHGVLDCYTLIRDWYKQELSIELPDYHRESEWWEKGADLYMDNIVSADCRPIIGTPQRGDIILMQVRAKVANHAAVYLGDGEMLHHLYGRLSSRDVYGGYWAEVTRVILRHKDAPNV